jgi:hypothetical protein
MPPRAETLAYFSQKTFSSHIDDDDDEDAVINVDDGKSIMKISDKNILSTAEESKK